MYIYMYMHVYMHRGKTGGKGYWRCWYGVATISRLLKIVGLFCRI